MHSYDIICLPDFYAQDLDNLPAPWRQWAVTAEGHLHKNPVKHGLVVVGKGARVAVWNGNEDPDQTPQQAVWYVQPLPIEEPDATECRSIQEAVRTAIQLSK